MKNSYSILINTCDKFEDCWHPFFKLWSIYWSDCNGKLYLNTEYKDYQYHGLDITPLKVCANKNIPPEQRATWSQCLKWALEAIDSDIILYMQEDYFLTEKVDNEWVEYFLGVINKNPEIPCIQLTHAGIPAIQNSGYEKLYYSNPDFFSYVSCQASFWRKEAMLKLVREHETAWNFEWWGSKRAKYLGYKFFVIDPEYFNHNVNPIISYVLTGVVGGKWYTQVVELFEKHQIDIDFSKRGFYETNEKLTIKQRIKIKLSIWKLKSIIEILKLKISFFFKNL